MKVVVVVKPGSSQSKVVESVSGESRIVTIWTHARTHDGEANKAVIEALADFYKCPKTSITLVKGHTSKQKIFEIEK